MKARFLRIHGDNIIECERTLKMLAEAYHSPAELQRSPIYLPKYTITTSTCQFVVELLSGHGRWGEFDLGDVIYQSGGKLRESADSYLTEILEEQEFVLLGIEYCSALPAGNNAWQRNGRALACVLANVPYLYYAEIGGIELDENRSPKAPRYPNPVVPFSYVSLSHDMHSVCLPVYRSHPSMTRQNKEVYQSVLGYEDGLTFIRQIINGEETADTVEALKGKTIQMVEILSNQRKKNDTLKEEDWKSLLVSKDRSLWLVKNYKEQWSKKTSSKVHVSETFALLKSKIQTLPGVPLAAKDLPCCIVPKAQIPTLIAWVKRTYNGLDVSIDTDKDLAIVWITGFKPRGDDSRPDRGLAPLCRMALGPGANIMAIVSGPGKREIWNQLRNAPAEVCQSNGLFQSIFACCNYLLIDSATCDSPIFMPINSSLTKNTQQITIPFTAIPAVEYSEHDTDCAIHQIFSNHTDLGIYESFCNPPGGDWSGISFAWQGMEYKWTSLPRVSDYSKRPDHIIQIENNGTLIFAAIESKSAGKDLESNIGERLKDYIKDVFDSEPTAYKASETADWQFFDGDIGEIEYGLISVGAFLYKNDAELKTALREGNLDVVFAFEFKPDITILHFHAKEGETVILDCLYRILSEQRGGVVQVHVL